MDVEKPETADAHGLDLSILESFFDKSPHGVLVVHEGVIIYINQVLCKMMGISLEQAINQKLDLLINVLPEDEQEKARERFESLFNGSRKYKKSRYRFSNLKGEVRILEISANPVITSNEKYIIAYVADVTTEERIHENVSRERKAYGIIAEAALSSDNIAAVCERVLNGLTTTLDFEIGTIRLYNEDNKTLELASVFGLDETTVIGTITVDDPNYLAARTARTKQPLFIPDFSKVPKDLERMKKPKELGLQALIFWPIMGSDNTLLGVINVASRKTKAIEEIDRGFFATVAGMFSTIIERRKAEDQLKESQEQFIAFADNMPGPVFIKDHQSRVIFVNRFMRIMSSKSEKSDFSNIDLFSQRRAEELTVEDQKVLTRGAIDRIQKTRDNDGKIRTYRSHKFPIFREGKPPLIGGFSLDITDRVEAERQREEAKARAEFFNDLLAHDINNMHQGIMASLELIMQDEALPEHLKQIAERALKQVNRSVSLINNVRKFGMINQGDITLEKTDPAESLYVAIETVKQTFPHRRVSVHTNLRKNDYCIMANEFLKDVFYNLLHNSVKVTESDDVKIEVEAILTEGGEYLRLDFIDYGSGISDSLKDSLLVGLDERVRRVSGVGLTLVKQIVDQYSGKISVEDRVKGDYTQGARFVILLPNGC